MALSRRTDPITSQLAAEGAEASGRAPRQRDICLAHVRAHIGRTSAEIAKSCALNRYTPSRRLPELRDSGLVFNGHHRICCVTQRLCMTWWPVWGNERERLLQRRWGAADMISKTLNIPRRHIKINQVAPFITAKIHGTKMEFNEAGDLTRITARMNPADITLNSELFVAVWELIELSSDVRGA